MNFVRTSQAASIVLKEARTVAADSGIGMASEQLAHIFEPFVQAPLHSARGGTGLGLAVAEPDTRVTMTDVAGGLVIGNAFLGVVFSILLSILRRWELDLREGDNSSEKFRKYAHRLYLARHVVIWLSVTQTVAIMLALG